MYYAPIAATEPEGDLYLPMDMDNQPPVDPSPGVPSPDVDEENYMVPDQPGVTHEQPAEIEQEEYDDIESVKESSKQFLTTEVNQKGTSPSLSPAVSAENITDKKRKSSLLTSKKKKNSDSSSDIAMPEKTAVILNGYLEYRSGVIGRSTKYWVSLSSCSLYLAKSEDDSEAVKVVGQALSLENYACTYIVYEQACIFECMLLSFCIMSLCIIMYCTIRMHVRTHMHMFLHTYLCAEDVAGMYVNIQYVHTCVRTYMSTNVCMYMSAENYRYLYTSCVRISLKYCTYSTYEHKNNKYGYTYVLTYTVCTYVRMYVQISLVLVCM